MIPTDKTLHNTKLKNNIYRRYHTGPKLHPNDIKINEIIKNYCNDSVLVIIDAKPKDLGLPTDAYIAVEEVRKLRHCSYSS